MFEQNFNFFLNNVTQTFWSLPFRQYIILLAFFTGNSCAIPGNVELKPYSSAISVQLVAVFVILVEMAALATWLHCTAIDFIALQLSSFAFNCCSVV